MRIWGEALSLCVVKRTCGWESWIYGRMENKLNCLIIRILTLHAKKLLKSVILKWKLEVKRYLFLLNTKIRYFCFCSLRFLIKKHFNFIFIDWNEKLLTAWRSESSVERTNWMSASKIVGELQTEFRRAAHENYWQIADVRNLPEYRCYFLRTNNIYVPARKVKMQCWIGEQISPTWPLITKFSANKWCLYLLICAIYTVLHVYWLEAWHFKRV